jgi:mannose-6-phosphate isomerase-like protein (cupin superfamily)
MSFVDRNGVQIYYERTGSGPAIVFAHGAGGTRFRFFVAVPEEWAKEAEELGVKWSDVHEEYRSKAPGLGETLEIENPGMHTTDTIDYGVVISGEAYLELGDGQEVLLKQGDTYVQNGTRHAWHNRSKEPCVVAVVMVGAKRN